MSFEPSRATSLRLERARLLNAAGLADLAESELRFAARTDGQPQIIAVELAKLLDRRGAHDESLRAVKAYVPNYLNMPFDAAPVSFWRVAFPMPYRSSVERYSREKELDPYVVAGLIRQESEFNPKAISVAKAYGLTQVLPSTGRYLSRNAGISKFSASMLFQPEINLRLGTHYMRQLLNSFQASWERTLAAYNGGPTRVARWNNWGSFREPSEFIETIPIQETRDYVQIVLRNASVYRKIYGPTPVAAR
jgi:soluble lytic murein transglycosylase